MKGHRIGAKQKIGLTVSFVGTGIVICGLNGAGKSTLGKALAEKLDFYFIDNEHYFTGFTPYGDTLWDIEKFAFFSKAALSF